MTSVAGSMLHVPMSGEQSITILHLSDLQFGRNHRFGRLGLPPPDDQFDTLFARLKDDLGHLRTSHNLVPQLVIVTGDIAEWGKAKEFDDAQQLLENLEELLGLQRHRIIVIPGNHDINRMMCDSYFKRCEADDAKPVPPYWPKWEQYSAFFQKLYAGEADFTFVPDQPWTLFPIPDLKVVIAGLNSTMVESHIDGTHHGHVGEAQLRWFAERLESFRTQGWLRIGAVHHNVQRNCVNDDENLHDANDLERILGPSLNLVLHGHRHDSRLGWVDPNTPIISTGSAAVTVAERPEEVPNQYQVIRVSSHAIERANRRFDAPQKKWLADTSSSKDGAEWITEQKVFFANVDATLPGNRSTASDKESERRERRPESEARRSPQEVFLDLVSETCRHRYAGATVTPVSRPDEGLFYLRVLSSANGIVQHLPVAAFSSVPQPADLDRFCSEVVIQFRAHDPGLRAEVVYGGSEHASDASADAAAHLNLRLFSLIEYRGLIDFRRYLAKQNAELDANPAYPNSLYVPQAMEFEERGESHHASNAFIQLRGWLTGTYGRFVLILGDFGTGKTFLMRQLARDLAQPGSGVTPLLVELRPLEKARSLDELMAAHLTRMGIDDLRLPTFRHMLTTGRIVLLFDGFDELAGRVSYDRALEHFDTLLEATGGAARIVVTSRTSHFENENQVRKKLGEKAAEVGGALRYCRVQRFDESKIRLFLTNRFGDAAEAGRWFDLLHDVNDLLGLSEYPRMLSFITDLDRQDLENARNHEGKITAATLYHKVIVEKWLDHEYRRLSPRGAEPLLDPKQRLDALTHLAMLLWTRTDRWITVAELSQQTTNLLQTLAPEKAAEAAIAAHQIGSGTLLVRDDEGRFGFSHQSIMEWLIANRAANELGEKGESTALAQAEFSRLMAEFLIGLQPELASDWADQVLATAESESTRLKGNALRILERIAPGILRQTPSGSGRLDLSSQDLRQEDLERVDLRGADLRLAILADQRLAGKDLTGARLDGANLVRADLTRAILANASLEGANLSEARLLGADLRGARIANSVWRRAKLIGALFDDGALVGLDTWGSALPDATETSPCSSSAPWPCLSLAWSPDGSVLAIGYVDGAIRLWDVRSGRQLRHFTGHQDDVTSVTFSPDGIWLASGSDDETVRLWEASTGRQLRQLTGHHDYVSSVAFSHDGARLASGSVDKTVRLWDTSSGRALRTFTGHKGCVRSVTFNPRGNWLASGSDDKRVRLWETDSGKKLRQFTGHQGAVRSVAFNKDGTWLASGSADNTVRLWEVSSGRVLQQFTGHKDGVASVAFSPDEKLLVSASADHSVRLWDTATGKALRLLTGHQKPVTSVSFSPDGSLVASGSHDKTVRIWDAANSKELRQFTCYEDNVESVAFSSDGSCLASGGDDRKVRLWEAGSGKEMRQFIGHEESVVSVAFSPDGTCLASGSDDKTVRLWDAYSGAEVRQFTGHEGDVNCVAFSPDGNSLASGSSDKTVRLWEAGSGRELRQLTGNQSSVYSLAFSPDGRWLTACSDDKAVRLWEANSGREVRQFTGHKNGIWSVAFSPDGTLLASGGTDATVRLWDTATGRELRQLKGHRGWLSCVTFSPSGTKLATGADDKTVRLWEVGTGRDLHQFTGHQDFVLSVAFSPDGAWLASGSSDSTVRLWNTATGAMELVLLRFADGWAAFAPDGRYKYAGNPDGGFWYMVNLCRFELGELDPFLPNIRRLPLDEPFLPVS